MIPLLKREVQFELPPGHEPIRVRYLNYEVALSGSAREAFLRANTFFDGSRSVKEISEQSAVSERQLEKLLAGLRQVGMVVDHRSLDRVDGMEGMDFYDYHRLRSSFWLQKVYAHPFWEKVASGAASRAQILGFAFEKYHYIEGAHEHMAFAVANADPEMMKHLALHFNEEYAHGDIYRRGLRAFFGDEVILTSQPLPTTRALINYLSEMAQKSSFSYYAGNELLQMTENTSKAADGDAVDEFYRSMQSHYPWSEPLIEAFRAHTALDQHLGHEDAFRRMCADRRWLSSRQVEEAMTYTRGMAEMLELFMDGIDRYYEHIDVVPRVASHLWAE